MEKELGKLWDKFKSDILKTTKEQWVRTTTSSVIMTALTLTWLFYIFIPVMEEANKYAESVEEPSILISGSMMGFIMLSLWFTFTWINFTLTRYTMKLIFIIIRLWEIINTKYNNKKRSVD